MKILALLLCLFSTPAFAKTTWTCDNGTDVEGAGISVRKGALLGEVQWDCFPGGGYCNAQAAVQESRDDNGDLVYRGRGFWMIVHVSEPARDGAYKAHLIATDLDDAADMGRGIKINTFLSCK